MAQTPASAAMPYIQQEGQVGQQYFNPYIQQGQQSNQLLGQQYGNLVNDPTAFLNSIMSGYQQSPYATYQEGIMTDKMENAGAAGGYAGTPYNQGQIGSAVQAISSKDMQSWLNNVLGMYKLGLMGEGNLSNQGFQASGDLAGMMGNMYSQEGNLAYSNQAQKIADQQQHKQNLANMIGAGAGFASSLLFL